MIATRTKIIDQALARLDPLDRSTVERIAEMPNGLWYLKEKIVATSDTHEMHDHTRPLKYAAMFLHSGAQVSFVREQSAQTPDLRVDVDGHRLYVEVRKFRMDAGAGASDPVSKIVSAIDEKRGQLPSGAIGFVAVDNFDIRMEPGLSHGNITDALSEIERRAISNPAGWRRPSGVILAAASTIGSGPVVRGPPHFVWTNPSADPDAPIALTDWTVSALPDGRAFRPATNDWDTGNQAEHRAAVETLEF